MDAAAVRRSDFRIISLVGTAHGFSHFYQLALPPLFPLIHGTDGIAYTKLGLLTTVMYIASAVLQPPAGFLVDRFGARTMLLLGIASMATGTTLYGFMPSYEMMLVAAVLIGVGNSVFHPCDYSVLSASVSEPRIGRAFSLHMFGGYVGYALAPFVMSGLGVAIGWKAAIIAAGLVGFVVIVVIALGSRDFKDSRHERAERREPRPSLSQNLGFLFRVPILLCWLFFCVVAMGQIGLQTKTASILTLPTTYALDLETGGLIVTFMLVSVAIGVLLGGVIADRTTRHDLVVGLGYGLASLLMLALWRLHLPLAGIFAIYVVTGIVYGIAFPSRDVLVRRSTPKGASGKVFGFVYSGMDVGSFVTPVLFGYFIDTGIPLAAFLCVAILWSISILILKATTASAAARDVAPA